MDVGLTHDAALTKEKKDTLKGHILPVITAGVDVKAKKSMLGLS